MTVPGLAAVAGAVTLVGLLSGFAAGFLLGGATHARLGRMPDLADLELLRPGSQALIQEIGSLASRLTQLEASAGHLAARVGTNPFATATPVDPPIQAALKAAGGPLVEAGSPFGPENGTSMPWLVRGLDDVESSLERTASLIARRDLDRMAFPSRMPIPGVAKSSGFGRRLDPFTRRPAQHAGFDYVAPHGPPLLASAGGRVRRAGPYGAFGRTVEIDHGDGLVTRYGHLSRIHVRVGDLALPGQQIATVGSTGRSTGPHLHFEILRDGKPVQPDLYLADGELP